MVYHEYTLEELDVHHEAILRREAEENKALANVMRVAQNAKAREYKKFIKQLEETGNRIDKATGQFQTTAKTLSEDLGAALETVRQKKKPKPDNK